MAQRPFWRWKDDDLTVDINAWPMGMWEKGLYRGYDQISSSGMVLSLGHAATGYTRYSILMAAVGPYGIVITPQGTLVQDDTQIDLTLSAGNVTHPRIDLIVAQHQYSKVVGGLPMVYLVYPGTPAATPVAPTGSVVAATDIVLGQLYVPAGATDISQCTFTKSKAPSFAGDKVAYLDRVNRFTKQNQEYQYDFDLEPTLDGKLIIPDDGNTFTVYNTNNVNILMLSEKPVGTKITLFFLGGWGFAADGSAKSLFSSVAGFPPPAVDFVEAITDIDNKYSSSARLFIRDGMRVDITYTRVGGFVYALAQVIPQHSGISGDYVNTFSRAQLKPFGYPEDSGFSGCRFKQISYVVSSVTYTAWILEVDSRANSYVLNLDNTAQLNGFNLSTDKLELRFMDILESEFGTGNDLANGWNPKLLIKRATAGTSTLIGATNSANPLPVTGTYAFCANVTELSNNVNNGTVGEYTLANAVSTTEHNLVEFEVSLGRSYRLSLISAHLRKMGGTAYSDNTFVADGLPFKDAIDALSAQLAGETIKQSNVTESDLVDITSVDCRITWYRVGKMVTYAGSASIVTTGTGLTSCQFQALIPNGWVFDHGGISGVLYTGSGTHGNGTGNTRIRIINQEYPAGSKLQFLIDFASLASTNVDIAFTGSFLIQ
jgi:hypothetical protein